MCGGSFIWLMLSIWALGSEFSVIREVATNCRFGVRWGIVRAASVEIVQRGEVAFCWQTWKFLLVHLNLIVYAFRMDSLWHNGQYGRMGDCRVHGGIWNQFCRQIRLSRPERVHEPNRERRTWNSWVDFLSIDHTRNWRISTRRRRMQVSPKIQTFCGE